MSFSEATWLEWIADKTYIALSVFPGPDMDKVMIVAGLLGTAACAAPETASVGMANPASVYCARLGGKTEIHTGADGAQSGYCHLPDGRVAEEWALFRAGNGQK